jgi:hypothetical protein
MEIKCRMVKELDDGSAIIEVTYDREAHEFLMQQGLLKTIQEALKMEKKKWMGLKYGMKCILGRWQRKLLKSLGLGSPSLKSEKQWKPYPTTSNTGNSTERKKNTSRTRQHGSTKAGQMTKSTLPQKKPKSQNSLGIQQTNSRYKKAGS